MCRNYGYGDRIKRNFSLAHFFTKVIFQYTCSKTKATTAPRIMLCTFPNLLYVCTGKHWLRIRLYKSAENTKGISDLLGY
jgi:hypothetical protein